MRRHQLTEAGSGFRGVVQCLRRARLRILPIVPVSYPPPPIFRIEFHGDGSGSDKGLRGTTIEIGQTGIMICQV